MSSIVAYLAGLVVLALLDGAWLSYAGKAIFNPGIGPLLAEKTNYLPATIFYLLYPVGMLVFAVTPALRDGGLLAALKYGAAFGFFVYMSYDMTNMATLKVWPLHLAMIDIAWGSFVTSLSCGAAFFAASRFVAN